ncbi:MAG: hypothetical protein JO033_20265, partial [Acidobacteriaceae bacterium]|nr:hypothetical protein [Acidobacteriaceae bacterium]
VWGAVLISVGCGMTVAGLILVIPACTNWSLGVLGDVVQKSRDRVENAASSLGEFAGRAQHHFQRAAKTARAGTSRAAGAVETAARQVKEYTS